jgi:hypothetical protein
MNTQNKFAERVRNTPAHNPWERGKIVSKTLIALVSAWVLATLAAHHDKIMDNIAGYIQKSTGMRQ